MKTKKIIFMGTPDYASEILSALLKDENIEIASIYTQPDKPVGRKKVMTPPDVKVLALEHNLKIYQPTRLRDDETVAELLTQECDMIIVAAYGQILPKAILDHAPCINLHASILPQYRGASPIQQSLLNGDIETGVTAMMMDVGLDTGDILKISKLPIADDEMVVSVFDRLSSLAAELTLEVIHEFSALSPVPQVDEASSHCKKITKADGELSLYSAQDEYNKYRAFTPWPGVYLESGLKLKVMSLEEDEKVHQSHTILSIDKESAVIACEQGSLRVSRVQPNSKKEMSIIDYLNGKRLNVHDQLS